MIRAAVRRPVAVSMAYATVALLGVVAWLRVPVELLPDTELPRLTLRAAWPGASPETVEAFLTAPLEATLQQVRAVERIESVSLEGSALVAVELERDADLRLVRLDLSERLATLERDLPADVRGPWVQAYVPAELERESRSFMRYTVTGPLELEALRALVDTAIAPAVREVRGVADVVVAAGTDARVLSIEVDDARLASLGLEPGRVSGALISLDGRGAAGSIDLAGLRRPVSLERGFGSVDEVRALPLASDGRRLVRVSDVAAVRDTSAAADSWYRVDGRPALTFEVLRAPRTNAVRVAAAVRDTLAALPLPGGARLILDEDQGETMRAQLGDLRMRAIVGACVVFLVLLRFLRSARAATIVFATIGFSILLTLNLLYFGGLSLNMLTLMGLAMGLGLIDDNAIVVLESIHRRRRLGDAPAVAAERGARDVVLPVLAATATTLAVVVPFVWLQGELRVYYLPFALVVGCAMLASLIVSFSFVPALAARLPAAAELPARAAARRSRLDLARVPAFAARRPVPVIAGALGLAAVSFWMFERHVPRGVLWSDWWSDRSWISVEIELPRGSDAERVDAYARVFEARLAGRPGVQSVVTNVAAERARIRVTIDDSLEASALPLSLKEELVVASRQFGGAQVEVYGYGPSFYGGARNPPAYSIVVLGYNYAMVRELADQLASRLRRSPRVRDVDTNATGRWNDDERAMEVVLHLDREGLAAHGLTARDVVRHVVATTGGGAAPVVMVGSGERSLALRRAREVDVLGLEQSLVRARGGGEVRLGEVASVEEREVMGRIERVNQQYRRVIAYEFRGPFRLGERYRDALIASTRLPAGFALETETAWSWDTAEQRQIAWVVVAALGLVFMVTAALFESLRQPVIVLLTVPMALTGVFLTFWLTGASFTREAYIGSIMMAGIVVNNSILLVDRYNQLIRGGIDVREAAARAAADRAQPILMTTATTVLGMLPLVLFSRSADASIWNAIGYAVIGGLVSSTVLVLVVTPALLVVLRKRAARAGY